MSTPMVTLDNAPRDEVGLMKIGRAQRYRLCLTLDLWGGDENKEGAFFTMSNEDQTKTLLSGLHAHDGSNGSAGPATPAAPPPAPEPAPEPEPAAPGAPAAMTAPTAMTPEPEPVRTPSTQSDPENAGDQRPEAAPDAAKLMLQGVLKMGESVQNVLEVVQELSDGHDDLYESVEIIRRAMVFNTELALLVATQSLGLERKHILRMVEDALENHDTDTLFEEEEEEEEGKDE